VGKTGSASGVYDMTHLYEVSPDDVWSKSMMMHSTDCVVLITRSLKKWCL